MCVVGGPPKGINKRTGQPYVRGAYNKDKSGSAAGQIAQQAANAAKQAAAAQKASDAAEKAAAAAQEAAEQIKTLKAENARLVQALEAQKLNAESEKKAAMLEASQKAAEQMLQRYKDGLRDGASFCRGGLGHVNLSSSSLTPDSAAGSAATPTEFAL